MRVNKGRQWLGWQEWTLLGAVVVVVLGVAAILSPGFRALMTSQATIGWVQAIGVLLAIVVSLQAQRVSEWRQRRARLETIRIVALDCAKAAESIRAACLKPGEHFSFFMLTEPVGELRVSAELLGSLSVYDFPNGVALRNFIRLNETMSQILENLHRVDEVMSPGKRGHVRGSFDPDEYDTQLAFQRERLLHLAYRGIVAATILSDYLVINGLPVTDDVADNIVGPHPRWRQAGRSR